MYDIWPAIISEDDHRRFSQRRWSLLSFAVYGVLIGATVLFTYVGLRGFAKRVID